MKYKVKILRTTEYEAEVEAENEDQAKIEARLSLYRLDVRIKNKGSEIVYEVKRSKKTRKRTVRL